MTPGWKMKLKKGNTMPSHRGAFKLKKIKRTMNNFIHAIDGFFTNDLYYTDTDSLNIEKKTLGKIR